MLRTETEYKNAQERLEQENEILQREGPTSGCGGAISRSSATFEASVGGSSVHV